MRIKTNLSSANAQFESYTNKKLAFHMDDQSMTTIFEARLLACVIDTDEGYIIDK